MIRKITRGNKKIWAEWTYNLSYDIETGKFTCECKGFIFNKKCEHIKEFKKKIKEHLK